jgi:DNA-binding SARP family transcriptional activator
VLGPLEVLRGGEHVDPGPYKQRVVLAALLLRPNTIVPVEQLLHAIWEDEQPRTARKNLQVYICALRRIVGDRIAHRSYGYRLEADADELDLLRFDALSAAGRAARRAGDPAAARLLLAEAAGTWRDRALVDLADNPYLAAESKRLAARRLGVCEDWFDLEIDAGHHLDVLDELAETTARHPLRERLVCALMTALDRSGSRSEALACYEAHRQAIARTLGLDPSPVLQQLYGSILAGPGPGPTAPAARPEVVAGYSRPAQLPRDVPDFVGRGEQVRQLVRVLSAEGGGADVAVVSGQVASGKTALAVRVGHLLADRFPDGQVFVLLTAEDGAPRPWREVLAELMRGTGLGPALPIDDSSMVALWRSWVADRRFLFVLDDAVDEQCVRKLLPGCGASRTLVTGTRRMSGLESVYRLELGELAAGEAVELLERSLGPTRMLGAADAVRRITDDYGGLPLVVRAIAAKLTLLRHVTAHEYADRIGVQPEALDELAAGGRSLRQRLLRFHAGLDPLQQEAFRSLGGLPGPRCGHADLVGALDALGRPPVLALESLMDANLVAVAADDGFEVGAHSLSYEVPAAAYRFAVELWRQSTRTPTPTPTPPPTPTPRPAPTPSPAQQPDAASTGQARQYLLKRVDQLEPGRPQLGRQRGQLADQSRETAELGARRGQRGAGGAAAGQPGQGEAGLRGEHHEKVEVRDARPGPRMRVEHLEHAEHLAVVHHRSGHDRAGDVAGGVGQVAGEVRVSGEVVDGHRLHGGGHPADDPTARREAGADQEVLAPPGHRFEDELAGGAVEQEDRTGGGAEDGPGDAHDGGEQRAVVLAPVGQRAADRRHHGGCVRRRRG